MPSSYTTSLRLTLPATGELAGQWGNTVNTGITELLDAAVAGTTTISTWGGAGVSYTLSNNSGSADEARRMFIVATGTPGEAKNVICPAVSKFYVFRNDTTGGFALTLKTPSGTGVSVPAGQYRFLYCDGTNVVEMFNSVASLRLSSLTSGRVTYAGSAGLLQDSANLTFNGTDLTVSGAVNAGSINATTLDLTNLEVTNIKAKDGTASMTLADATGVATFSANPILNAGTANGVLYLNGSKVATSGSVLTFDGANLGIGKAGGTPLDMVGTFRWNSNVGGTDVWQRYSGGTGLIYDGTTTATDIAWIRGAGEQMRLTSTGLGIGTSSPVGKLDVRGATYVDTDYAYFRANNALQRLRIGTDGVNDIYLPGTAPLTISGQAGIAFSTDFTERMRLDASGNLGIGTSSPASKLHVSNTAAATRITITDDVANGRSGYIESNFSDALVIGTTSGVRGIRFSPDNTPRMFLDTSGNLGIGTSSPGQKLVLQGSANQAFMLAQDSTATYQAIYGADSVIGGSVLGSLSNHPVIFRTNNTEKMRLSADGNLGLGVPPSASYSNSKNIELAYALLNSDNQNGAMSIAAGAYESGNTVWTYKNTGLSALRYQQSTVSGAHAWYTAPSGTAGNAISFTQAMTLDASGRLQIGTTTQEGMLTVVAPASTGYGMFDAANSGFANLTFKTGGTVYAYIGSANAFVTGGTANDFAIRSQNSLTFAAGGGTERARITSGGDFGIGTSSPGTKLQVVGTIASQIAADGSNSSGVRLIPAGSGEQTVRFTTSDGSGRAAITGADVSGGPGVLRFYVNNASAVSAEYLRITSTGNQVAFQPAESAQNTSVTLTVANLQARIITSNAAVTLTLPTGTSLEGYTASMAVDTAFECTFIATTASAITIAANGNTTVGSLTVAGNTSGTFRFRKTATNTFTVYRVA